MFDAVLVANRGEIAVRVIRTLRRLGIRSVAVYSDADADAPHVAAASTAIRLGPGPARESYLSVERVIDAAGRSGAEAIHPGYGFLSENAAFARACAEAGLTFVGPPPEAIEAMGDKIRAKATVEAAGVPVVPGVHRPSMDDGALVVAADEVGYPLLVKAAAGGGGKGMRVVRSPGEVREALAAARREARGAFGDDELLLERYLDRPRHIEVQVLADRHGAVVHLGERECSLQRRHQKVIEECPSPFVDADLRRRMGAAAVQAARACRYEGAGTIELIVAGDQRAGTDTEFFFLEMNTRLQVEHPVTEEVYGLDLVEQQLRVAAGEPLQFGQDDVRATGWSVEARVYAEDPSHGFLPTGGRVLAVPGSLAGEGVRLDSGVAAGTAVPSLYDPMLAKVVATAAVRDEALRRLHRALGDFVVLGMPTNVAFLRALLDDDDVRAGRLDTGLIERKLDALVGHAVPEDVLAAAALAGQLVLWRGERVEDGDEGGFVDPFDVADGWRLGEHAWTPWSLTPRDGNRMVVHVRGLPTRAEVRIGEGPAGAAHVRQPEPGVLEVGIGGVVRRYVHADGEGVTWIGRDGEAWALRRDDDLAVADAAGQAGAGRPLVSPLPGTVTVVNVAVGDTVAAGQTLLVVEAMKMEHPIVAAADGVVAAVHVRPGQAVAMDAELAEVQAAPREPAA